MGLARLLGHAKRKARVILIFLFAVTFTATLAFYNSQQVTSAQAARRSAAIGSAADTNNGQAAAVVQPFHVEETKEEEPVREERYQAGEPKVDEKPKESVATAKIAKEVTKDEIAERKEAENAVDEVEKVIGEEEVTTKTQKETNTMTASQREAVRAATQRLPMNSSNVVYPELQEFSPEFDTADIYKSVIAKQEAYQKGKKRSSTPQKLRVFILPFTHVDPGWLRTFDSYSNDTNWILTNMHSFMTKNKAMRFMWAEFVFFERWWRMQNETVKDDVRLMVKEGRLELASGSWVMTDEANAYFPVSVDNIIEGHQFLQREFGIQPTTIWSNDPFGYSNSVPYIFRQAGIKRNVINRIHHGIKGFLQNHKAIPFQWRQYFDKSGDSDVLTQVLPYTHYDILNSCGPNSGSCCEFDFKRMTHWNCPGPKPVPITRENVKQKAETLLQQLETMAKMYEAPVLLMMHGDDFRFDMIEEWHQHHDNFLPLFEEINKGSRAQISFGTFNDYFTHLEKYYKDQKSEPATLTGDFFPYRCAMGDMWTGYYTTRPFYKRQGRLLHTLIRAGDVLSAQAQAGQKTAEITKASESLESARRTLSLFQHHDAITGTSKIHVMKDYSNLLFTAQTESNSVVENSLKTLLSTDVAVTHSAALYNETQTKHQVMVNGQQSLFVSVFNPLPYSFVDTVSLRVNTTKLTVTREGQAVRAQIEPYIYKGEIAQSSYLLTIPVELSPLSVTVYEVKAGDSTTTGIAEVFTEAQDMENIKKAIPSIFQVKEIEKTELQMKTERIRTKHHPEDGLLQEVWTKSAGEHRLTTAYLAYKNAMGGAYLMRVTSDPVLYTPSSAPKMLVKGPVQQSIHSFLGKIYQRVTIKDVEGPLGEQVDLHIRVNIQNERNTEVALQIKTDLTLPKVYADSVGLQLLNRERLQSLDTNSNYYPMPSAAVVEDDQARLTVSSNVEHGMMSLQGGVEIMLDRMLNQDDGKGLGTSEDAIPTDLLPVDMQFSLLFEKKAKKDTTTHYTAHTAGGHLSVQNVLYPPIVAVSSEAPKQKQVEVLPLPCDYQLLTIRPVAENKRLLTIFRHGVAGGASSSSGCGTDVTASVRSLLTSLNASKVQETNLSGTKTTGDEKSSSTVEVHLEPFRFLSLLVTISSS